MSLSSLDDIAREISDILKQRARTLASIGLEVERRAMGPTPGAHWPGGPKIIVRLGDDAGEEVRYALRRGQAEKYLRRLRESPANIEIDARVHE